MEHLSALARIIKASVRQCNADFPSVSYHEQGYFYWLQFRQR